MKSPTRVTATTSSQLDLILTDSPSYFHTTAAIPCHASDHHVVITHFCSRGISQCLKHNVISVRQYHKIDTEMLDKVLLDESWSDVFGADDIDVCTKAFTLVMQYIMNALVPLQTLRIKQHSIPWGYNPAIAAARRQRDLLHRKALKSSDSDAWVAYKRSRNKVTAMV